MNVENPAAFRLIFQDELYLLNSEKTLYNLPMASQPIIKTQPATFNYLGGHKKNFLIIVHYPATEFIDDKHLTALESILKRLEYSLEDTAILNRANYPDVPYGRLADFFKPQKLLLLGSDALPAGLEKPEFNKPGQIQNYTALFSYSFDEMMDNNDNKKAFWEQMKKL